MRKQLPDLPPCGVEVFCDRLVWAGLIVSAATLIWKLAVTTLICVKIILSYL